MKKRFFVFGLLTILLTLALAGCANGTTGLTLTDFITIIYQDDAQDNWIPVTSFSEGQAISIGIRGKDPNKDIVKYVLSGKKGEAMLYHEERDALHGYSQDGTFSYYIGEFSTTGAEAGTDYSITIYAVDAEGNQSNVKTAAFSITEN